MGYFGLESNLGDMPDSMSAMLFWGVAKALLVAVTLCEQPVVAIFPLITLRSCGAIGLGDTITFPSVIARNILGR